MTKKEFAKLLFEKGNTFTFETINTYDYKNNIKSGIKVILDLLNKENESSFNVDNIYGVKRPVSFNKEIIERAPKLGRNPKTGEEVKIGKRKSIKFRPGKAFLEKLN